MAARMNTQTPGVSCRVHAVAWDRSGPGEKDHDAKYATRKPSSSPNVTFTTHTIRVRLVGWIRLGRISSSSKDNQCEVERDQLDG